MTSLTSQRLHNQHLSTQTLDDPAAIVQHLGAVQAQEYGHARWALGMRSLTLTDADVEQAFTDGSILRTHVMRPTWHFLARDDIGWMLSLTGPRVHKANAHYYKQTDLSPATLAQTTNLIAAALENNHYMTRKELTDMLEQNNIPPGDTIRSSYILMYAELEGIICSGPRRGKQFTYALISERAPKAIALSTDEALAELARRYFTSHGPACLPDYVWWSGLTMAEAKRGIELCRHSLESAEIDGRMHWFPPVDSASQIADAAQTAYLLPIYDEYGNSYKIRTDLEDPSFAEAATSNKIPAIPYQCPLIVGGKMLGTWKRDLTKTDALLEAYTYRPLTPTETAALKRDIARYGKFHNLTPIFSGRAL